MITSTNLIYTLLLLFIMTSLSLLTLSVVFQLIEAIERDFPSIERNWLSSPRIYLMTPSPICAAHFLIRRTKTSGKPRPTRSDNLFYSIFSKWGVGHFRSKKYQLIFKIQPNQILPRKKKSCNFGDPQNISEIYITGCRM